MYLGVLAQGILCALCILMKMGGCLDLLEKTRDMF